MAKFNNISFDVKSLSETGEFEGYAATFNNVDLGGDTILPGAFKETIKQAKNQGRSIPVLMGHEMDNPDALVGGITEIEEDDIGLKVKGQIIPDLSKTAKRAYTLVKNNLVNGLSIGYRTVKDGVKKVDGGRILSKLDLFEVSIVAVPMDTFAGIVDIKSTSDIRKRLSAGERLTKREWEMLLKTQCNLTNSQAEKAVYANFKSQVEPDNSEFASEVAKELKQLYAKK